MYCKGFVAITTHNIYTHIAPWFQKELKINGKRVLCTAKQISAGKWCVWVCFFSLFNRFEISIFNVVLVFLLFLLLLSLSMYHTIYIYSICFRFLSMLFQNFYSLILLIRLDKFRLKMLRLTTWRNIIIKYMRIFACVFINICVLHKCFFVALGIVKWRDTRKWTNWYRQEKSSCFPRMKCERFFFFSVIKLRLNFRRELFRCILYTCVCVFLIVFVRKRKRERKFWEASQIRIQLSNVNWNSMRFLYFHIEWWLWVQFHYFSPRSL